LPETVLGLGSIVIGYLLGSVPGAYIIARVSKGVDIRKVDTGNVGASSTLRAIGIWQGIVAGIVDITKGSAAIYVGYVLNVPLFWTLGAGVAAFLGHNYSLYLGFKGGQGVATMIGVFLVLSTYAMLASLAIFVFVLYLNRRVFAHRVFFAVLVAGPFLPIFIWLFNNALLLVVYSLIFIIFMVCKNWRSVKTPTKLMGSI
jgi:glycerol-3-phosphate acyltransferase PlsY